MENEIWKDIKDYEGYYQVSSLGRIKSLDRIISVPPSINNPLGQQFINERIMKIKTCPPHKYFTVILSKGNHVKAKRVGRLVAEAFILNPENKPQVNHINGIKTDDRVENLEWSTQSENIRHAYKTGLAHGPKGEKQGSSKLNEKQVRVIKHCLKLGMKNREIAKYFPCTWFNIKAIQLGKSWGHITI